MVASLERLAERDIDLTAPVYARLFTLRPEFEAMFILGPAAKGHMLEEVIRVFLDASATSAYAPHMLAAEQVNHDQLGVPPADFSLFLDVVARTVTDLSGPDLTPAHAAAWGQMLATLKAPLQSAPAGH